MADLPYLEDSQLVSIVGTDALGAETYPIRATPNRDLAAADTLVSGGLQGALTVGGTAVEAKVGGAKLANRKSLVICPTNGTIYWGYTNAVTVASGMPLFKNQTLSLALNDSVSVWLISSGSINTRITEGA